MRLLLQNGIVVEQVAGCCPHRRQKYTSRCQSARHGATRCAQYARRPEVVLLISRQFIERVYDVVARIPHGRVTTYGRIARALGAPSSARMVGWALSRTPPERALPAHRVVNRVGFLSGALHFGHPDVMRGLLLDEGIPFVDEDTVDLDAVLWDPADDPSLDYLAAPVPD